MFHEQFHIQRLRQPASSLMLSRLSPLDLVHLPLLISLLNYSTLLRVSGVKINSD